MRMQMTSQIDAGGNDPIFLMFHGYGNDESEMMRILDAVYAPTRADAAPAAIAAVPSYISFRATYARPYMSGNYWYPDGCGVDERQRECAAVGDSVVSSGQGASDVVRCRDPAQSFVHGRGTGGA